MSYLEFNNVSKSYGERADKTEVLENINLKIDEGEFICIVGFSGSGKTTLMSLVAGLTQPDKGSIVLAGQEITSPAPDRGLVFQNYSLYPWLTVHGNVMLAVKQVFPEKSKAEREEIVEKYVAMVNLSPALHKKPSELSGGMRQRVSVARALAMNPKVLLLDEPLSALDALTRGSLQDEITKIWEADRKTAMMITNDVDEALLMADRIIPLTPGPNATLGKEFKVNFGRPRIKTELNENEEFKKMRNEITKYLIDMNAEVKQKSNMDNYTLPDIKPTPVKTTKFI